MCCVACWEVGDQVDEDEYDGDGDGDREGWCGGGDWDAESVGDVVPDEVADDEAEGDADDEPDGCEDGGLPGDGGANLTTIEAEGLEEGEVAAAAAHGGDERVSDCEEREGSEECAQRGWEPVDLLQAGDFDGDVARVGGLDVWEFGDRAFRARVWLVPGAKRPTRKGVPLVSC